MFDYRLATNPTICVSGGRAAGSSSAGPLGSAAPVARCGGAGGGDAVAGEVGRDAWRTGGRRVKDLTLGYV